MGMKTRLFTLALLFAASATFAQTPAKRELAARILKIQEPSIEAMAQQIAEQPLAIMMGGVSQVLATRIPPDKREALGTELQNDVKRYITEAVPLVRDRAVKLGPGTIGALLEERFSEEELRQLVTLMESPAYAKFQQLGGDMQRMLLTKLVAEVRPVLEPKVKALELTMARRLGIAPPAGAQAPARPASR